ncbi:MAG: Flp pilus assembly complex ATPase component TadA [archaeon]|nr:MAG: Flp pilus assembly complex ATPase component TadA [archaeon]
MARKEERERIKEQERARKEAERKLKAEMEATRREERERRDQERAQAKQTKRESAEDERAIEEAEKQSKRTVAQSGKPGLLSVFERKPVASEIMRPRTGRPVPPNWKVIERYPIYSAFVYATIAQDPTGNNTVYFLDEVPLSDSEAQTYTYLMKALENELTIPRTQVNPSEYFDLQARKIASKYSIEIPKLPWSKILYFAERDIVGFGDLDGLLRDANIEDISVDGIDKPVFIYHNKYERIPTNVVFEDAESMTDLIGRFAHISGRHVSTAYPIVQGTLPGGHRMIATYMTEVSPSGGTLNIRRFREDPITIIDMLKLGVLDFNLAAYTWLLMENKAVAMVVGATGSGKTTLLNALLTMTRTNAKIITIEEVQELNLAHPNWSPLVSREKYGVTEEGPGEIGLFELVKAAMRMRPDIIVVGEVRGEEAYVLFQAISTGHGGFCTLHADEAASAIQRLTSKPMDVPDSFISFLDLVYTVRRVVLPTPDGGTIAARRIISVDEVGGVGDYTRMFNWDPTTDTQTAAPFKNSRKLQKLAADLGKSMGDVEEEIRRRSVVLKWMRSKDIRNFRETTPLFESYVKNPNETYQRAVRELGATGGRGSGE